MSETQQIDRVVSKWVDRRAFAKAALGASVGAAVLGTTKLAAQAPTITDTDILNFALNLEYLEAEFYTVITSGVTIDRAPFNVGITGVGTPGPTTGASRLALPDPVVNQTAQELAYDERAHVTLLRNALGSAAVAKPAIDFSAAGVTTVVRFIQVARILEDVGVSAYGGAAPLISDRNILGTAARIALAEGLHAGSIRLHMAQRNIPEFAGAVDVNDIIVSTNPRIGARLYSTDANGLTAIRTPSQVLSIVYGPAAPAGTSRGLLYPNGMNGVIRTV